MFTYKPLLKLMIDRDVKKMHLKDRLNLSPATVAKISKDEFVSLEVINRLCNFFQVQPNEIMEHIPDVITPGVGEVGTSSSSADDLETTETFNLTPATCPQGENCTCGNNGDINQE